MTSLVEGDKWVKSFIRNDRVGASGLVVKAGEGEYLTSVGGVEGQNLTKSVTFKTIVVTDILVSYLWRDIARLISGEQAVLDEIIDQFWLSAFYDCIIVA